MNTLTLVRGIPGSGKTTLARNLRLSMGMATCYHFEADDYFYRGGLGYQFDATKLRDAHMWCLRETDDMLFYKNDVIVSNTFTTLSELKPYFEIAKKNTVSVNVVICQGEFGSIHNVPAETIQKMKTRFVWDISKLYESLS
jgi:uridine kinase